MAIKPDQSVIDACKKNLDGRKVLLTVINETPELRQTLLDEGVIVEKEN